MESLLKLKELDVSSILASLGLNDVSSKQISLGLTAVAAIPVTFLVVDFCVDWWNSVYKVGRVVDSNVPGPPTRMIVGNLHQHPGAVKEGLDWIVELSAKHKTMFRLWFGPARPVVVLVHPEVTKQLLKTTEPKLVHHSGPYHTVLPWLGRGLLIADGPRWARNRRLLTPGFHFDVLKPYAQIYNDCAETLITQLMDLPRDEEDCVDIYKPVSLSTLQTVLKCAFSSEEDVQAEGLNHPYVAAVTELTELVLKRNFNLLLYTDFVYFLSPAGRRFKKLCDYVHSVAENVIQNRRRTRASGIHMEERKRYLDFLDILLSARDEDGKGLTDLEIREEADTFLFEGHDTTASGISWTLYSLAAHPEIQQQAREEVQSVLGESSRFEWEDLSKLPFLTQCIKETIRLHTPVPYIGRQLTQPLTIGGIDFPKYTRFTVSLYALHHNPHVWGEDNMEYKPERFNPENSQDRDSFAFAPFSAGPRNCIGQTFAMSEMRAIIGKVLNSFKLETSEKRLPVKHQRLVMKSANGICLKLTPL